MKSSSLESLFLMQATALKLPIPVEQYRFHDTRRWRFDFAWPYLKFAVEINGGEFRDGGHNRGLQMGKDCEKIGEAMILGWNVYVCTGAMVKKGNAIHFVERYLKYLDVRNK